MTVNIIQIHENFMKKDNPIEAVHKQNDLNDQNINKINENKKIR